MTAEVWGFLGSVVVAILALAGVVITARTSKSQTEAILKTQLENMLEQIKSLEKKQDKHNSVIERTFSVEKTCAESANDIKTLYHHIDGVRNEISEAKSNISNLEHTVQEINNSVIRLEERVGQSQ